MTLVPRKSVSFQSEGALSSFNCKYPSWAARYVSVSVNKHLLPLIVGICESTCCNKWRIGLCVTLLSFIETSANPMLMYSIKEESCEQEEFPEEIPHRIDENTVTCQKHAAYRPIEQRRFLQRTALIIAISLAVVKSPQGRIFLSIISHNRNIWKVSPGDSLPRKVIAFLIFRNFKLEFITQKFKILVLSHLFIDLNISLIKMW